MVFEYDPDKLHIFIPKNISGPKDFIKHEIDKNAVKHKLCYEVIEENQDHIKIKCTEANKHTSTIYLLEEDIHCSCKEYEHKEVCYCKHISILKYLVKMSYGMFKSIKKQRFLLETNKSKTSKYKVYDYYNKSYTEYGLGPNEIVLGVPNHSDPADTSITNNLPNPYTFSSITLFDYQRDNLHKMIVAKKALCCMTMGAGKTLTCVAGIKELNPKNILIVSPKSVLTQWDKEITTHLKLKCCYVNSTNIDGFISKDGIGICTYQFFVRNTEKLSKKQYDLVICDEIQYVRNGESKTWSSVKSLKCEYFWGLSGTLIENRLDDLYSLMSIINPTIFGPLWKFENEFKKMNSITNTKILYANECKDLDKLKSYIQHNIFSHDTVPSRKNLNIIDVEIYMDKSQEKHHNYYLNEANRLISKSLSQPISHAEKLMIQAYLLKARQSCNSIELIEKTPNNSSKVNKILDLVHQKCIVEGTKVVIYSEWTEFLDIIAREISKKHKLKYSMFTGSLSTKQRTKQLDQFRNDPECMIFMSSDAGGVGIDGLQYTSNTVIHTELPWNPARLDQRTGRLHRFGQVKDVDCYRIYTKNSIEQKIYDLLKCKKDVRMSVLF